MTDSETPAPLAGQLTIYGYEVVRAEDPQDSSTATRREDPEDPEASELSDPGGCWAAGDPFPGRLSLYDPQRGRTRSASRSPGPG